MATSDYPRPYGSYMLLERLGQGGMSEVELARRAIDDASYVRFLVIKRIHPRHSADEGFVRMFQDEARINAELQHENIAQVYDFGRVGDEWFLAMEYVPGRDLREIQHRLAELGEGIPLRVVFRVLADVLAGLSYAHSRVDTYGRPMRIVHRDVNPRNIMLSVRGEVKLIDFGVAKADTKAEKTVGHSIKGKFAYMAPEQIEGASRLDGRADVFAVGLVMHELITGSSPFAGLTEVQIMHRILSSRIPPLDRVPGHPQPEPVKALHRRALAHNLADRYPDATSMREDVVRAAEPIGGLATREEMADFVRKIDPDGVDAIGRRLRVYRELSPGAYLGQSVPEPAGPVRVANEEGSLSRTVELEELTRARSWRRWATAGAALALVTVLAVVLITAVGGWLLVRFVDRPERPPDPVATPVPPPEVVEEPVAPAPELAGAAPEPAPEAAEAPAVLADETPATVPQPVRVATHPANLEPVPAAPEPEAPPAPEPVAPEPAPMATATAPEQPPDAGPSGYLYASSNPARGFEVLVDGQNVGTTPLKNHRLGVGPHQVLIRDPATGQTWSESVVVEQGRPVMVKANP